MVRVMAEATYATKRTAAKTGVKTLLAKVLTGVDPCCGCVIVEFRSNIGTDSTFYTKGRIGHCDEVEPKYIFASKAKSFDLKAEKATVKAGEFGIGARVQVVTSYDAAKVGMEGTIRSKSMGSGSRWGIQFDTLTSLKGGHSLNGELHGSNAGQGQWVPESNLKLITTAPKPKAPESILDSLPEGVTKVLFSTSETINGTKGRPISKGISYYGWVTTVDDDGTKRQVIEAPFGGQEWLSLDAKDPRVSNIRKY